jgi:hypothetical protein
MRFIIIIMSCFSIFLFGCSKEVDDKIMKEAIENHVKLYIDFELTIPMNKGLISGFKINNYKTKVLKYKKEDDSEQTLVEYVCEITRFRKDGDSVGFIGGQILFSKKGKETKYEFVTSSGPRKGYYFP